MQRPDPCLQWRREGRLLQELGKRQALDVFAVAEHCNLTTTETLGRAQEVLDRLSRGENPDTHVLAGASLASAWAVIPGDDVYRIGGMVASPVEELARPRVVPLLAIDRRRKWALVVADHEVDWWVLNDSLPGEAAPDPADVSSRATAWVRRWLHGG